MISGRAAVDQAVILYRNYKLLADQPGEGRSHNLDMAHFFSVFLRSTSMLARLRSTVNTWNGASQSTPEVECRRWVSRG